MIIDKPELKIVRAFLLEMKNICAATGANVEFDILLPEAEDYKFTINVSKKKEVSR